jgi:putative hydrolase of the HAD superfamily
VILKSPKAILFDLDDTLITHKEALQLALTSVYPNHPELERRYDLQSFVEAWKESLRWDYKNLPGDKHSEEERRISRIRNIWGAADYDASDTFCLMVAAEYFQIYKDNCILHDDVPSMLEHFSGVPLGVVTNGYVYQQNQKLRQSGVDGCFRVVVTSEEAGVGKPAPFIFCLVCQKLEVNPEDAVFVGDLLETDALGAQAAGLNGIWLNRGSERDDRSAQVQTIQSLAGLKKVFV